MRQVRRNDGHRRWCDSPHVAAIDALEKLIARKDVHGQLRSAHFETRGTPEPQRHLPAVASLGNVKVRRLSETRQSGTLRRATDGPVLVASRCSCARPLNPCKRQASGWPRPRVHVVCRRSDRPSEERPGLPRAVKVQHPRAVGMRIVSVALDGQMPLSAVGATYLVTSDEGATI